MATIARRSGGEALAGRYGGVRRLSLEIAAPLSDADATIQPHPDASPAKWHLAHTTWFFETFLLRDHLPGYRLHAEDWAYLFNSYYEGEGERHARPRRGMLSRPSLDDVREWRLAVDSALLDAIGDLPADRLELGLNHEQQHQELMLMDLLAAFAENPLAPALWPAVEASPAALPHSRRRRSSCPRPADTEAACRRRTRGCSTRNRHSPARAPWAASSWNICGAGKSPTRM